MKFNFKEICWKLVRRPLKIVDRKRLKNRDFTIISDNCWGGQVYKDLDIEYKTPFVGLFVFSPDYLKLLKNLKYYLDLEMSFTTTSKYGKFNYPIGLLDDVEIHFLHYSSEDEAKKKWDRRTKRINWENILVKMNDADYCNQDLIEEFDKLNYNKVFLSALPRKNIVSLVQLRELKTLGYVKDGIDMRIYRKYFDVVKWINSNII